MTEKLDTVEQRVTQTCDDFVLPVSCILTRDRPGSVITGTLPPPVYLHISTPHIL